MKIQLSPFVLLHLLVRHMTVIYANPGAILRLSGGLGPLQDMAVAGTLTCSLTPASDCTSIEMTYTAGGYHPKGLSALAAVVDMVLGGSRSGG